MSTPVAQNFPSFQPTELYAYSGRIVAPGLRCVAGSNVRTYPGGRKAATAVHSNSLPPILSLCDEVKAPVSSSHATGIRPGMVKS